MPEQSAGDKITVTAYFGDSAGLFVGNDVGVLGVPVGKITDIEPEGDRGQGHHGDRRRPSRPGRRGGGRGRPVRGHRPLRRADAGLRRRAEARRRRRDRRRPDRVPGRLRRGARDHQRPSPPGSPARRRPRRRSRSFIDNGAAAFRGNGELFNRHHQRLAEAVSTMSGQRKDFAETIVSLDVLVGTIAENDQTVRTFVDQVADASSLLADERGNFRNGAAGAGPGGHRGGGVRGRQPGRGRATRSTTRPRSSAPC